MKKKAAPAPAHKEPVVIVWMTDDETACILMSHNGVRVYRRDAVDPRAGSPPYHALVSDGIAWAKAQGYGPDAAWQMPVRQARRIGLLDGEVLADFGGL